MPPGCCRDANEGHTGAGPRAAVTSLPQSTSSSRNSAREGLMVSCSRPPRNTVLPHRLFARSRVFSRPMAPSLTLEAQLAALPADVLALLEHHRFDAARFSALAQRVT